MRELGSYNPFKGICRALVPSFPTKNQGIKGFKV